MDGYSPEEGFGRRISRIGVCASFAWAQLEEIIATGARLNGEDYSRIPAIVLERRADFLVQRIRPTNDTRGEGYLTASPGSALTYRR